MIDKTEKIILGVDPGTRFMGYGVLLIQKGEMKVLQYGVINVSKYSTQEVKLQNLWLDCEKTTMRLLGAMPNLSFLTHIGIL